MQAQTTAALQKAVTALQLAASLVREDTKQVVASGDHIELLKHFNDIRNTNDLIKESREAIQQMTDDLSTRDIPDLLRMLKETRGLKTPIVIEGVGRCTVSYRFSCSMLDKEQGMLWLRENGHGGLIQPTVNAQTLGAFAKNLIEVEGKDLPDDIFKTGTSPYTSITKVK